MSVRVCVCVRVRARVWCCDDHHVCFAGMTSVATIITAIPAHHAAVILGVLLIAFVCCSGMNIHIVWQQNIWRPSVALRGMWQFQ